MDKEVFIEYLRRCEGDEVFVKIDNVLYEPKVEKVEEQFDGFDTFYPSCVSVTARKEQEKL